MGAFSRKWDVLILQDGGEMALMNDDPAPSYRGGVKLHVMESHRQAILLAEDSTLAPLFLSCDGDEAPPTSEQMVGWLYLVCCL